MILFHIKRTIAISLFLILPFLISAVALLFVITVRELPPLPAWIFDICRYIAITLLGISSFELLTVIAFRLARIGDVK